MPPTDPTIQYKKSKFVKDSKGKFKDQTGEEFAPLSELLRHAATVGDPSVLGSPSRPDIELLWRMAMVASNLSVSNGHYVKSRAYVRLDPSEKSAVSYFLGMVQASFMAEKQLGNACLVHLDAAIELSGAKVPNLSRPDLVGFKYPNTATIGTGRLLLEAKGRSNGTSARALNAAKKQITGMKPRMKKLVAPLLGTQYDGVASIAYFGEKGDSQDYWRSHLEDPPVLGQTESAFDDNEFRGLIIASKLQLVRRIASWLMESHPDAVEESESWTTLSIPEYEVALCLRSDLLGALQSLQEQPDNREHLIEVCRSISTMSQESSENNPPQFASDEYQVSNASAFGFAIAVQPDVAPLEGNS